MKCSIWLENGLKQFKLYPGLHNHSEVKRKNYQQQLHFCYVVYTSVHKVYVLWKMSVNPKYFNKYMYYVNYVKIRTCVQSTIKLSTMHYDRNITDCQKCQ